MDEVMKFTFNEDMITEALCANGYSEYYHPDNWIQRFSPNPDWSGVSKKTAFEQLLRSRNLIPRDVKDCWNNG